ncbi:hypothetical protein [Streptomyces sp. NPDC048256]
MTQTGAIVANLAVAAVLLAAAAYLIRWATAGEPGRAHHDQEDQEPTP